MPLKSINDSLSSQPGHCQTRSGIEARILDPRYRVLRAVRAAREHGSEQAPTENSWDSHGCNQDPLAHHHLPGHAARLRICCQRPVPLATFVTDLVENTLGVVGFPKLTCEPCSSNLVVLTDVGRKCTL